MNKKIEGVVKGLNKTYDRFQLSMLSARTEYQGYLVDAKDLIQEMQKELEMLNDKLNLCETVKEAHKRARGKLEIENHRLKDKFSVEKIIQILNDNEKIVATFIPEDYTTNPLAEETEIYGIKDLYYDDVAKAIADLANTEEETCYTCEDFLIRCQPSIVMSGEKNPQEHSCGKQWENKDLGDRGGLSCGSNW